MLVTMGALFGAMIATNRVAVTEGVPPLGYAFHQCFGASLMLLAVCLLLGDRPDFSRQNILFYLAMGGLGLAIPFGILAIVAPHLPAGVITLLLGFIPAATYAAAIMVRMTRLRFLAVIGLTLGLAGLLLLVMPKGGLPEEGMETWVAVVLLSVASSAASNIVAERFRPTRSSSSLALGSGTLLGASVVLLPASLVAGQTYLPTSLASCDAALGLAMLITAVNLWFFFEIVRRAGAVFLSQFNYIVVPSGIVWGMLLFGERHSQWTWLAVLLMLAGIALVNARAREGTS